MSKKALHNYSLGDTLDYHYNNNIPFKLIYDDNTEQIVKIISYDPYNLVCKDIETEESFVVFKHSLKKIETQADLKSVIDEKRKE